MQYFVIKSAFKHLVNGLYVYYSDSFSSGILSIAASILTFQESTCNFFLMQKEYITLSSSILLHIIFAIFYLMHMLTLPWTFENPVKCHSCYFLWS